LLSSRQISIRHPIGVEECSDVPWPEGSCLQEPSMMGEPRRPRTAKATSKRLSGQKATPAKSVGRPSVPPSTIVNLRISLDLLDRLDRYIAHLEGQTGLPANRGMSAPRA